MSNTDAIYTIETADIGNRQMLIQIYKKRRK